ncbi:hypothetical protein GUJ93_ZPchr0014g47653 [Zizania palustris]|uniref:Pentatricopeptide repeat-containing protein n=1 Tax=Zizania palustris TaxID=103762 RepID=A0A8J5TBG6_ZIZPA|nr:hypothetical protein GUJ93_ZPchr0014g47653 [Zizania palustris]
MTASFRSLLASPIPLPARSLLAAHALLLTYGLAVDAALLAHFVRHLASARLPDDRRSAFRVFLLLLPRCAHQFNAPSSPTSPDSQAGDSKRSAHSRSSPPVQHCGLTVTFFPQHGALRNGRQTHAVPEKAGFPGSMPVWNALVTLYVACGQCSHARKVFDEMAENDVVSLTALVSAFTRVCMLAEALVDSSFSVFDILLARDIVSWTVMLSGLVRCECRSEALEVFNVMQKSGVKPDKVVLSTVLSTSTRRRDLATPRTRGEATRQPATGYSDGRQPATWRSSGQRVTYDREDYLAGWRRPGDTEEQRGAGAAVGDSGGRRREEAGESATTGGDSAGEWGVGGQREIRLGDGWSGERELGI